MIFCVEDDDSIRELVVYTLRASGFDAEGFGDGASMLEAMQNHLPRLIILDIMLPGTDGLALLKQLRAAPATAQIPIIMATAKGTEFDKVQGLDAGADDYLVKPFGMMEMVSRIRAVLRRLSPAKAELTMGSLSLNPVEHTLRVEGLRVELTLKEYDLLKLFLEHPGQVFSRDQLLERIWGMDFQGETRTVDVHIGTLRTKLGAPGSYIRTVRGVGYRMEMDP
ncbi:MAG: response regulator transcription factor [Oscillospiraceae bacterium]|nr:response regulator transcription factor [Oscillospiraceae bacterium]